MPSAVILLDWAGCWSPQGVGRPGLGSALDSSLGSALSTVFKDLQTTLETCSCRGTHTIQAQNSTINSNLWGETKVNEKHESRKKQRKGMVNRGKWEQEEKVSVFIQTLEMRCITEYSQD